MDESYKIFEYRNRYTLYKDGHVLLVTSNKHLAYRYMYECMGVPVPLEYTRKRLDSLLNQDISVDKPQ